MLVAEAILYETTFPVKWAAEKIRAKTKLKTEIVRTNFELTDFKTAFPL